MKLPVALLAGIAGLASTTFVVAEARGTAHETTVNVRAKTEASRLATTVAQDAPLSLDTSDAGAPKPTPKPVPKPKPQPRPDPCPACGMG